MTNMFKCVILIISFNIAKACGKNGATAKEIKATKGYIQGLVIAFKIASLHINIAQPSNHPPI